MRIAPTQQESYPSDIGGLIKKFGDELVCSICLNIYEDPVLTPCNHAFCRECIETAVNLTKKGSTVPLNQCPVCKSKATKRSLNPSARLAALAKGYERLAEAYSKIIGDENWAFGAGLKGAESNYTGGGQPLENLSQLYPYPEKPKPLDVPEPIAEVESRPSSPLIPAGEDFSLGFNTLAALDRIELPSTPDILKRRKHDSENRTDEIENRMTRSNEIENKMTRGSEAESRMTRSSESEKENIEESVIEKHEKQNTKHTTDTAIQSSNEPKKTTEKKSPKQLPIESQKSTTKQSATITSQMNETEKKPVATPMSRIKIKARTIKVEANSTPAKAEASSQSFIVSTSGIKGEGLAQLAKWSDQFKISVLPELTGSNTLILATDAQLIVSKRTMKYFEALLQPETYKLISSHWIEACLKAKRLLPHQIFLIKGDQVNSAKHRRASKPTAIKTLFASHRFYFYGSFNQPPPDQLSNLIQLTGSQVIYDVEELPNLAKSYKCMVLVDASNQVDYEKDAEIIRRFPILSATWVLDCFSCQRVLDYKEYLLL